MVSNSDSFLFACDSLELPWKDNDPDVSCIPKGTYIGVKVDATVRIPYPHILIPNVPNRTGICIHRANFVSQLRGCIAVGVGGMDINKDGQLDVTESKKTFDALMAVLPETFEIVIE
jgi:hypothetical protein